MGQNYVTVTLCIPCSEMILMALICRVADSWNSLCCACWWWWQGSTVRRRWNCDIQQPTSSWCRVWRSRCDVGPTVTRCRASSGTATESGTYARTCTAPAVLRLFACPRRAYWSSACHQVYSSDQPVLHLADWEHKLLDQQPPVSRSYQVRLPPHFVRNHHLFAQECNSTNMYVCARAGAGQQGPIKALMHILLLVRTRLWSVVWQY